MNIGVFGYYNYGNVGDQVILEAIQRFLSPHRVIPISDGPPPVKVCIDRLNNFDYLILGGGGLFNSLCPPSPFYCFDKWSDLLQTPLGVLGLGVEILNPEYSTATLHLVEKSEFFIVRDEESKNLIGHPKIQVAPDLTFYQPLRTDLHHSIWDPPCCGVNLRGSQPVLKRWIQAISGLPGIKKGLPFSIHPAMDDRETLVEIDPNCPGNFSIDLIASIDILVGFAFHSIIFAIQNGIPTIAINYKPKVGRMMEEIGLGEYVLELEEPEKLPEIYKKAIQNRELIRYLMLNYTAKAERDLGLALESIKKRIESSLKDRNRHISARVEPKASVLIDCQGSKPQEIEVTVRSILDQTHPNVEILVISNQLPSGEWANRNSERSTLRWIFANENSSKWLTTGIDSATGDYVTLLHAGNWMQVDALSVMINTLISNPQAQFVHTDHFSMIDGIILQKISKGTSDPKDLYYTDNLSFLMEKESASKFIGVHEGNRNLETWKRQFLASHGIHISQGLLFRPASKWEIEIYRSAIAFSRDQIEETNRRLEMATRIKPVLTREEENEIARVYAQIILAHLNYPIDEVILRSIDEKLGLTPEILQKQRRKIISAIAMEWFYVAVYNQNNRVVLKSFMYGTQTDLANWITNRGIWKSLVFSALGWPS